MKSNNAQVINTTAIVVGGGILLYQIAAEGQNPYLMIIGLVLLMFGLYRATNFWVDTKDDHKNEENEDVDKNS